MRDTGLREIGGLDVEIVEGGGGIGVAGEAESRGVVASEAVGIAEGALESGGIFIFTIDALVMAGLQLRIIVDQSRNSRIRVT